MNAGEAVEALGGNVNALFTPNARVLIDTSVGLEKTDAIPSALYEVAEITDDGMGTFTIVAGKRYDPEADDRG